MFKNKTLMITGGTGSFGQQVLRRFLATEIKEIRIFSRDEKKQEDLRMELQHKKLKFYIGDVRDYESVHQAMKGVDYVFHAAALKQVPSCEFHPMEAVQTNVLGAENVLSAAVACGIKRVIVLSTDKAVYPINAMGLSKALMERLMVSKARLQQHGETVMCATRYGNVMASRGSVIPLFISQIEAGKPLTVTDPKMTRFLMSLDDSVDLVLHAYKNGKNGDIFVQKAPAATMADLAKALQVLFRQSKPLQIIGTRHGEKLYESLVSREEMARAREHKKYYVIPADNRELNYNMYVSEGQKSISELSDYTSHNTRRLNVEEVKRLLVCLDYVKAKLKLYNQS